MCGYIHVMLKISFSIIGLLVFSFVVLFFYYPVHCTVYSIQYFVDFNKSSSQKNDTQLYMAMDPTNNNWWDGLAHIQLGVSEIRGWMNQNMLKLNDKTELMVFTSKYKHNLYNDLSITIGDTVVDCI